MNQRAAGFSRENALYRIVAPHRLALIVSLPLLVLYWALPRQYFVIFWKTERLGTIATTAEFLALVLLFAGASWWAAHIQLKFPSEPQHRRRIPDSTYLPHWYVRLGLYVTILAYGVWFGLAVHRAGGVAQLILIYSANPWLTKSYYMQTIPGVTTLTEVAVVAIPLALLNKEVNRGDRILIAFIVMLSVVRVLLNLERLALFELIVPITFVLLIRKDWTLERIVSVTALFLLAVVLAFIAFASLRSLRDASSVGQVLLQGLGRFTGYYVTSTNNAMLLMSRFSYASPLYTAFRPIWRFPGLDGVYHAFSGHSAVDLRPILRGLGLSPEYNTASAPGLWVSDFGGFAFLWSIFLGFLSGMLWRLSRTSVLMAGLFSAWLVPMLEFMRIDLFTATRMVPAYAFVIGGLLVTGVGRSAMTYRGRHPRGRRSEMENG